MPKPEYGQGNLSFRLMSLEFYIRDLLRPPVRILQEGGLRSGMTVLDFGCGPGGFSLAAARLIGPEGLIYAVDIHRLALASVQRAAKKQGFSNVRLVAGDNMAQVPDGCVDMALLYDVLHDLAAPISVLTELHRALKPNGILSVTDHHLQKDPLRATICGSGLFLCMGSRRWTHQFVKAGAQMPANKP